MTQQRQPRQRPRAERTGVEPRRRQDYTPGVRARHSPPGGRIESQFNTILQPPNFITCKRTLIAAANVTRQDLVPAQGLGKKSRLIHLDIWNDTADVEIVEIYFSTFANISSAGQGTGSLFEIPFNSAYERFTRDWGIGLGPLSQENSPISIRRATATAGQTLHYIVWFSQENAN